MARRPIGPTKTKNPARFLSKEEVLAGAKVLAETQDLTLTLLALGGKETIGAIAAPAIQRMLSISGYRLVRLFRKSDKEWDHRFKGRWRFPYKGKPPSVEDLYLMQYALLTSTAVVEAGKKVRAYYKWESRIFAVHFDGVAHRLGMECYWSIMHKKDWRDALGEAYANLSEETRAKVAAW